MVLKNSIFPLRGLAETVIQNTQLAGGGEIFVAYRSGTLKLIPKHKLSVFYL